MSHGAQWKEFGYLEIYQTIIFKYSSQNKYFCWLDYVKDWKQFFKKIFIRR